IRFVNKSCSKLFEIVTIAHRHDNTLWRHHHPAAVLPLDLFDRTKAGQSRAGHHLIDVTVTLHVDVAVADVADRPVRQCRDFCRWLPLGAGRRRTRRRIWSGTVGHGLWQRDRAGDLPAPAVETFADFRDLAMR